MKNNKHAPTLTMMGLKLGKEDCSNNVNLPLYKRMGGHLLYSTKTKPNLMYVVILASRFMENPKETHLLKTKRIIRYVNGTNGYDILCTTLNEFRLVGYTDSDWEESVDNSKRTSIYVFHLGLGVISQVSKKKIIVSLSTTNDEYVVATGETCQGIWIKRQC